jgi:PST family polysaccharide transporter
VTATAEPGAAQSQSSETPDQGSRIARGLGWSVVANVGLRMGNLLVSMLMARLIAPEQFGVFAVALTVWTILGALAEFGLGSDLIRADDLERRAPTVGSLALGISALLAASMALAAAPIAASFRSPESESVIRVMALSVFIFGLTVVPSARLQRAFRQRTLFLVNGVGLLCSVVTMTVLATHGAGPASLAWGQVALQIGTVVLLFSTTRTRPSFGFDPQIARTSLLFCAPLAFANLLSWVLLSVDNLVVARTLGPAELGLYVLAFNVSTWPMSAIGASIRAIALPAFAQVADVGRRNAALVRCAGPTCTVAVLAGLMLSTLATPIIVVLYGDRWSAAASALVGLGVFGGLRVVLDLFATFLVAAGATVEVLLVQVGWLVVMIPAMYVGVRHYGLAGAGWSHVAVAVCVVLPLYAVCLHRLGVDVLLFLRGAVVPVLTAVPAVLVCSWIGGLDANPWLLLVVGVLAALLTYALPLSRWWLRSVDQLRRPTASVLEVS